MKSPKPATQAKNTPKTVGEFFASPESVKTMIEIIREAKKAREENERDRNNG